LEGYLFEEFVSEIQITTRKDSYSSQREGVRGKGYY